VKQAVEIAEFIRGKSRAGKLVAFADIEADIAGQTVAVSERATDPVQILSLIQDTVSSHNDIEVIVDDSGGAWYFSERFMTGAYARILLLKGEGPLRMMAEVIREHSRVYPRPVPLALFQCSPFNLSNDEIAVCLKEMMGMSPYRDIAHLITSIGNLFAYSTDHLDARHAAMLAEWTDVGQVENP
jgi:hypothetical protein